MTRGSEMLKVQSLVIGAGVVGLAIAERLVRRQGSKASTWVLEKNASFGMETSSRNSEVIHAGIYYPPTSLKARLCIKGKHLLYDFCKSNSIPYSNIGKWIIATSPAEEDQLDKIWRRAKDLDVPVHFLSPKEALAKEPNVKSSSVLVSPTTGIVDSHALMSCLETRLQDFGGDIFYHSKISNIQKHPESGFVVQLEGQNESIHAQTVINAAGLHSNAVSATLRPASKKLYFPKGHYVSYRSGSPLVSRLIYPVPDPDVKSLGIHCTLDLMGKLKFGPDIEYPLPGTETLDYSLPTGAREQEIIDKFHTAVTKYLRNVDKSRLYVDYAGIRPKLSGLNDPFQDFVIEKETDGFINLLGIESPGLTSSLAIAEYVVDELLEGGALSQ